MNQTLAPPPAVVIDPRIHRLSVDQYHRMIGAGILTPDDRVELIEGILIAKMPQHPPHYSTIGRLQRRLARLLTEGWHIRIQGPITLTASEPEPDVAVARGAEDAFDTRHPGPRELPLVIEVAESTLEFDRTFKRTLYAGERLPVYWIANLVDGCVEVHTQPRAGRSPTYRRVQTYARGQAVPVVIDGEEVGQIAVAELLP